MDRVIKYLRISLPLLFSIYVGFLIAFTHIHIVNGVTIVHSHPYQKNQGVPVEHEHTYAEFQLLSQIYTIQIAGSLLVLFLLAALYIQLHTIRFIPAPAVYRIPVKGSLDLRGPPSFL